MDCEKLKELLVDYLYGELSNEETEEVEKHLASCKECASELERLRKTRKALALLCEDAPELKTEKITRKRRSFVKRAIAVAYITAVAALLLYFFIPRVPNGTTPIIPKVYGAPEVERKSIALTVYNGGFGVVRDGRIVRNLAEGESELSFVDVAARIEPHTVRLRSKRNPEGVRILAQDFLFDLMSVHRLLTKRLGEQIHLLLKDGASQKGTLQSISSSDVVIEDDEGRMRTVSLRQVRLIRLEGEVATELVTRPTLRWLLSVNRKSAGMNEFELTYLTQGVDWRSDYDLILGSDGAELVCWLTLSNGCGTSFEDAKLKLVAGEVHRAPPAPGEQREYEKKDALKNRGKGGREVKEKKFFEYHMYEVMRPVTIRNGETKQIKMFERNIKDIRKEYWITVHSQTGMDRETTRRKATVMLVFKNSKENGLGLPLPKGRVRLFVPIEGENLFAKMSSIEHTPKDEDVKLPFGQTDTVVWRVAESRIETGRNFRKGKQKLLIRNLSNRDASVKLYVKFHGDWKITESSHKFVKEDAQTALFALKIGAGKELLLKCSWETVW